MKEIVEHRARDLFAEFAMIFRLLSTRDALSILDSWEPHLLLSDIGMPGEDGYSLIAQVRMRSADRGWTRGGCAIHVGSSSQEA